MTNERAIEILNPEHREDYKSMEPIEEACRMGMKALEKQIPKKPTFEGKGFDGNGNITYETWICHCCGEEHEVDYYCNDYKYCPWCGQMIDWRDFK